MLYLQTTLNIPVAVNMTKLAPLNYHFSRAQAPTLTHFSLKSAFFTPIYLRIHHQNMFQNDSPSLDMIHFLNMGDF